MRPGEHTPVWSLRVLDVDGPYCFFRTTITKAREIRKKLADFESMTWASIEGPQSHFVQVEDLARDAQRRLVEIGQDDIDELFSLRLSGRERIYGIRGPTGVLKLLWWDADHQVYPVEKKYT